MRASTAFRYFLLIYLTLFLNVLLPGHTRGAITTDGKHSPASCCCCGDPQPAQPNSGVPSQRDKDHCAICQFAAGLISVPVVWLKLDELGLLEIRPVATTAPVISLDRISTYFACGPPLPTRPVRV
jgi:hypothetical protein